MKQINLGKLWIMKPPHCSKSHLLSSYKELSPQRSTLSTTLVLEHNITRHPAVSPLVYPYPLTLTNSASPPPTNLDTSTKLPNLSDYYSSFLHIYIHHEASWLTILFLIYTPETLITFFSVPFIFHLAIRMN